MRALAFIVSFVLAFLLFAVQPMATKMVLPVLGGTPSVWNTAMLTFQLLLLAGYFYAHVLTTRLQPNWQWRVHGLLIAAAFLFLPLTVSLTTSDALLHQPIRHLFMAFLIQVGLPFFVLSATAPLLQSWVARSSHPLAQTPYVLYSASNLGSMLGLLGYVAVIEPTLSLTEQSKGWSLLFVVGAITLMIAGKLLKPAAAETTQQAAPIRPRTLLTWVWLAFLPSALSLGVTSYITTDIAAVPLLWVVPLALYLLSFVDAFRTRPAIVSMSIRLAPFVGMAGLLAYSSQYQRMSEMFIFQLYTFAILAFALHGWLARFKPATHHLTAFYFCMSVGGALGGVLNALVAPLVFTDTLEYPLSLLAASITAFVLWQRHRGSVNDFDAHLRALTRVLALMLANTVIFYFVFGLSMGDFTLDAPTLNVQTLHMSAAFSAIATVVVYRRALHAFYAMLVLGIFLLALIISGANNQQVLFKERSFFGVWKVTDEPQNNVRFLVHNTTMHGAQFLKQEGPIRALTYYRALTSAFSNLPVMHQHPYALMGLGAGTVKCFADANQQVDIFEIDPMVVRLAEDPAMFRYLSKCAGTHEVFLGDGRVRIAQRPQDRYGAIILDAFSSDSIPSHLVTKEAIDLYFDKLAPHGVVLFHTTNRHIDLWPLLAAQAKARGYAAYGKSFDSNNEPLVYHSFWVIMARDAADLAPLIRNDKGWERLEADAKHRPWTDDYVNIMPYLKMLQRPD